MRVKYDDETKLIFQIGDPIDHVCAAALHNAMYEIANLNAVCTLVKVEKGELPAFIEAAKTIGAWGFYITMPHKGDIIPFLDECDEASRVFHCVNHVKIRDGKLIGIGQDGMGMGLAIESALGKGNVKGKRVLMIGAGAVSGSIAADLCAKGASAVYIVNRTEERARYIAQTLHELYGIETAFGILENKTLCRFAPQVDIAVQCTSAGLGGSKKLYFPLDFIADLPPHCLLADTQYPRTPYLDTGKERGLKCVNGMKMLLWQMLAMVDYQFGVTLDESCLKLAEDALTATVAVRDLKLRRREE